MLKVAAVWLPMTLAPQAASLDSRGAARMRRWPAQPGWVLGLKLGLATLAAERLCACLGGPQLVSAYFGRPGSQEAEQP